MMAPSHRIGRLRFDFATASLGDALQLRARAEEVAWRRLPPLIAAVCDALAPAGLHVRIDRLALDLGACRPDALERDLPAAFEQALRAALGEAIAAALHAPGAQASACLPEVAALDEMAAYLRGGLLPMRHGAAPFEPGAALAQLIGGQPAALVALLRRLAHERHAIERLVRQTGQAGLHALLAALTPANSAVILAYLADFQRFHAQAASMRLAPAPLRRVLWIVTLGYLLHAADGQFNRRMFLARLIEAVAAAEGIAHGELLMLLHGVAGLARKRQPLAGPLLGVLDELLRPFGSGAGTGTGKAAARIAPAGADPHDLAPLLALLRANAGEPQALAQLLQPLPASLFARLVRRLQPVQAALILDYMAGLSALHQARPRLPIGAMALRRQLRVLVLRYFLLDAGTQFNRLRWLRRLLHELAASTGVSYRLLLDTLTEAVALLRQRTPLAGSLPESLAALAADAADAPAPAPACAPGELAALLARLRAQAGDPAALAALVHACPPALFARLVEHLAPLHATTILADIAQLSGAHRLWALLGDASLGQRVAPAALQLLLDPAPAWHDRGDWLRRLLQTLAAGTPLGYEGLLPALDEWRRRGAPDSGLRRALARLVHAGAPVASQPAPHDAEAAMALAERFLRTGRPHASGARLPALATAHPSAFATLLRRLHVAMSRNTDLLVERLLGWMLPEEVAAVLLPGQAQAAACWADLLADQEHASMATAWRRVLATALSGEALQAPGALAPPGDRLDRAQLLRHCLDTGTLPWWAPAGTRIGSLLAPCARLPLAFLHGLFFDASEAVMAGRLRRLSELAGADAATAVMARLAPWPAPAQATADCLPAPAAVPDAAPRPGEPEHLLAWLCGSLDTPPGNAASWRRLAVWLAGEDQVLDDALRAGLAQPAVRQRWAAVMPHDVLARIAHRLAPQQARFMLDLMTVVLAAWRRSGRAGKHTAQATLWHALLALLAETPLPAPRMIAARLLASAALVPAAAPAAAPPAADAGVANRLRAQAQWLARQGSYANVSAVLQAGAAATGAPARPAPRATQQDGDTVYLANAGLVLLHPFLPHFFRALNLLRDDPPRIANTDHLDDATRAVHLLQYLVDQRCDAAEPELLLNKLLCGLAPETPVGPAITPTPDELAVCDSLLGAVIANWPAIAATSPAGLRETFLQREGRLQLRDGKWKLTVARKTVDVLVDMLPWAISMVLHPWMPAPLSVEW